MTELIGVAKKDIIKGEEIKFTLKGNKVKCDAIELTEYGRKLIIETMIKGFINEP